MTADFGGAVSDDPCGVLLRTSPRRDHALSRGREQCCGNGPAESFLRVVNAITCPIEGSAVLLRNYANQINDIENLGWLLLDFFSK